jgi:hypothetical protein
MRSLVDRSRGQGHIQIKRLSRTTANTSTITNIIPLALSRPQFGLGIGIRAYHSPSLSTSTIIDSSTFPITKGYEPAVGGKPHFKKILIANRYVQEYQSSN